jgi:hypothetical protein
MPLLPPSLLSAPRSSAVRDIGPHRWVTGRTRRKARVRREHLPLPPGASDLGSEEETEVGQALAVTDRRDLGAPLSLRLPKTTRCAGTRRTGRIASGGNPPSSSSVGVCGCRCADRARRGQSWSALARSAAGQVALRDCAEMARSESGVPVWCCPVSPVSPTGRPSWDLPADGTGGRGGRRCAGAVREESCARGGRRGAALAPPGCRRLVRGLRRALGTAGVLQAVHASLVGTRRSRHVWAAAVGRHGGRGRRT